MGALVVGLEAGANDRETRKVPYLLAVSSSGDSPDDGAAPTPEGNRRLVAVGDSSSPGWTGA